MEWNRGTVPRNKSLTDYMKINLRNTKIIEISRRRIEMNMEVDKINLGQVTQFVSRVTIGNKEELRTKIKALNIKIKAKLYNSI